MPGPQLSHQLHLMGKLQVRYASPLPFVLFPQKLPYLLLHGPDFLLKRPGAHAQRTVPHDNDLLRAVAADNAGGCSFASSWVARSMYISAVSASRV